MFYKSLLNEIIINNSTNINILYIGLFKINFIKISKFKIPDEQDIIMFNKIVNDIENEYITNISINFRKLSSFDSFLNNYHKYLSQLNKIDINVELFYNYKIKILIDDYLNFISLNFLEKDNNKFIEYLSYILFFDEKTIKFIIDNKIINIQDIAMSMSTSNITFKSKSIIQNFIPTFFTPANMHLKFSDSLSIYKSIILLDDKILDGRYKCIQNMILDDNIITINIKTNDLINSQINLSEPDEELTQKEDIQILINDINQNNLDAMLNFISMKNYSPNKDSLVEYLFSVLN